MDNRLLDLYSDELTSLRKLSVEFAKEHPSVANNLRINKNQSDDPLVNQLMESFAFLTARVRQQLDDGYQEINENLLDILYPHFNKPIPSMAVAQFVPQPHLTSNINIPKATSLSCKTVNEETCIYQTGGELDLKAIEITQAKYHEAPFTERRLNEINGAKSRLSIQIKSLSDEADFGQLMGHHLRLYLSLEARHTAKLHELLLNNCISVVVEDISSEQPAMKMLNTKPEPYGLSKETVLLPDSVQSFWGYQLLRELSAFPEKFMFIDLNLMPSEFNISGNECIFHFYFGKSHPELTRVCHSDSIKLNCVPIINLFSKQSDPINLSSMNPEYHVLPDIHQSALSTEVYDIEDVMLQSSENKQSISSLYNVTYDTESDSLPQWYVQRKPSWEVIGAGVNGSETFIGLTNQSYLNNYGKQSVLVASILCTNRDLPLNLMVTNNGVCFEIWNGSMDSLKSIYSISPITQPMRPLLGLDERWQVISHISINNNSLCHDLDATNLKSMLLSYCLGEEFDLIIKLIKSIKSKNVTLRHPTCNRLGISSGLEVRVEFDGKAKEAHWLYLFGCVLSEFFNHYVSLNTFIKLHFIDQLENEIYSWQPKIGLRQVL